MDQGRRECQRISTLSTSRYTSIYWAPAMGHVCSGKPKDQGQFYGHKRLLLLPKATCLWSHAWFNVLLMVS